jgi:hypothetical protein
MIIQPTEFSQYLKTGSECVHMKQIASQVLNWVLSKIVGSWLVLTIGKGMTLQQE